MKKIEGTDRGKVVVYALSTCVWCNKTRRLLAELGVAHTIIEVDLLDPDEQEQVMELVRRYNSYGSFPTIIIDDEEVIKGYEPVAIKERLG